MMTLYRLTVWTMRAEAAVLVLTIIAALVLSAPWHAVAALAALEFVVWQLHEIGGM